MSDLVYGFPNAEGFEESESSDEKHGCLGEGQFVIGRWRIGSVPPDGIRQGQFEDSQGEKSCGEGDGCDCVLEYHNDYFITLRSM